MCRCRQVGKGRGDEKKIYGNIRRSKIEIMQKQEGIKVARDKEESMVILYGGIIEWSQRLWIRLGPKGKRKRPQIE
jgi:hypothetical protein